ncbi:MAG: hypothetical protein ABSG86_11955 [Thermoguttaceae bacterium]|jgi:hypothetical protein
MSDSLRDRPGQGPLPGGKNPEEPPQSVLLIPYPKIVFLYPLLIASVLAAVILGLMHDPLAPENTAAKIVCILFLGLMTLNLVILAFDFPRTTSLTLLFLGVAVVLGAILLFTFHPGLMPVLTNILKRFHPVANPTFFWAFAGILGAIYLLMLVAVRFDCWEVRPNELLHHHGFLSNLERFPSPHLRIDKEINDIFEYLLLGSGRLILQASDERRAIVLDNVPLIRKKEEAITRMLGALQVQVREEGK